MKSSWVWLIALNVVAIAAFYYIQQDMASREAYWLLPTECHPYDGQPCFQPSISRTLLFYVLSANCTRLAECSTAHIPGELTVDWSQVALLVALVPDVLAVWRLRSRAGRPSPASRPATERPMANA